MDAHDRALRARYYDAFHDIDENYSFFRVPSIKLADLKDLVTSAFPAPILF